MALGFLLRVISIKGTSMRLLGLASAFMAVVAMAAAAQAAPGFSTANVSGRSFAAINTGRAIAAEQALRQEVQRLCDDCRQQTLTPVLCHNDLQCTNIAVEDGSMREGQSRRRSRIYIPQIWKSPRVARTASGTGHIRSIPRTRLA